MSTIKTDSENWDMPEFHEEDLYLLHILITV